MNEIEVFIIRLKKININLELIGNTPWIYLDKVNGNKVKEPHDEYNVYRHIIESPIIDLTQL